MKICTFNPNFIRFYSKTIVNYFRQSIKINERDKKLFSIRFGLK